MPGRYPEDLDTADVIFRGGRGHLVLGLMHTLDAVSTVSKLPNMGVEPFRMASSLLGVIPLRLVRRLCEHCKRGVPT